MRGALILDPDSLARERLTYLLNLLGISRVYESRSDEALPLLNKRFHHLDFIILGEDIDGQASAFRSERAHNPNFAAIPLVWLVSENLSFYSARELCRRYPDVNAVLKKPVSLKSLKRGLTRASRHQALLRTVILYVGSHPERHETLRTAAQKSRTPERIVSITSLDEWRSAIDRYRGRVRAVLVDAIGSVDLGWSALARFRKTKQGRSSSLVMLTRDPSQLKGVGKFCDRLVECPLHVKSFRRLLDEVQRSSLHRENRERIKSGFRKARARVEFRRVLREAARLSKEDGHSAELEMFLARILDRQGKTRSAHRHYERALYLNPCLAGAYCWLLRDPGADREYWAEQARAYCPGHPQVAEMAANFAESTPLKGDQSNLRSLLEPLLMLLRKERAS